MQAGIVNSPKQLINIPSTLLAFILFTVASLVHMPVPDMISYVAIGATYVLFTILLVQRTDLQIQLQYVSLWYLTALIAVFCLTMVLNPSVGVIFQTLMLVGFALFNILLLPKLISLDSFLYVASRFTAVIVLFGFLPYIGLSIQNPFFDLSLWGATLYFQEGLQPITSIYSNPNILGVVTMLGSLAAIFEWLKYNMNESLFLLFVNGIGLLFTNHRAGWIAFTIGIIILIVYKYGGRTLLILAVASGISTTIIISVSILNLFPEQFNIISADIGERNVLWEGGVQATFDQYLGYGAGNSGVILNNYTPDGVTSGVHNTYIRMFMDLGIIGGILYMAFYIHSISNGIKHIGRNVMLPVPILLVSFFYIQLFESHSFLGASLVSLPIALIIGYSITEPCNNKNLFD